MSTKTKILGLVFALGLFLVPSVSFADGVYSACDITAFTTGSSNGPFAYCLQQPYTGGNRSVYAWAVDIEELNWGGTMPATVYLVMTKDFAYVDSVAIDTSTITTGVNVFSFDTPINVETNNWLYGMRICATDDACAGPHLTRIRIDYSGSGAGQYVYNIWYFAPYVEPPTTEFNEVIRYIPSTGVATSTGITEVGAEFSIAEPTFIEYIGYRIYDTSNQVVYNATSTADVAGLYTISTDYNFTTAGLYTGHAYFAQDLGGGNVWEVDNQTVQQILVDVPEWTIDPDGGFTQNPATTSTTTLSNLTLDCGDGFTGSVCNLIARIFIPSSVGIGAIQSAFGSIVAKAPFSFFTESKNVLGAFQGNGDSTGGTFALYLYDTNIDIVSTTSASVIGIGSTQLAFVKFLMSVGLWLLLAWYLYWRIASIFGV